MSAELGNCPTNSPSGWMGAESEALIKKSPGLKRIFHTSTLGKTWNSRFA